MKKGNRCSLQYHQHKHESVYVLSGKLLITLGDDSIVAESGKFLVIEPNEIHRMEALEDSFYLEASTPEMDDVVRVSDDYGRSDGN
jgi:quercetin dioxygenase-like cupin family protein